jgi:hypothetical protein
MNFRVIVLKGIKKACILEKQAKQTNKQTNKFNMAKAEAVQGRIRFTRSLAIPMPYFKV